MQLPNTTYIELCMILLYVELKWANSIHYHSILYQSKFVKQLHPVVEESMSWLSFAAAAAAAAGNVAEVPSLVAVSSEAEIRGYVGSLLAKHRKGQQVTSVPSNRGVQEPYLTSDNTYDFIGGNSRYSTCYCLDEVPGAPSSSRA